MLLYIPTITWVSKLEGKPVSEEATTAAAHLYLMGGLLWFCIGFVLSA
jgi:hypothetical protein